MVESDKDYIHGQPRLPGHRLSVAHVVANVDEQGLEEYLSNYNLSKEADQVKIAIEYCMNQACIDSVVSYCQGCNKNEEYPGEDLWKIAKRIYNYNFSKP